MSASGRWSRVLLVVGLVAMLVGAVDPLEGSAVILPGIALVLVGGMLGRSRHRKWLLLSFVLVAVGVGVMFGLSALGGLGGETGRSYLWAIFLLPYPAGWIMGCVGAVRCLRERPSASVPA